MLETAIQPRPMTLSARLEQVRESLLAMDEAAVRKAFALAAGERLLKTTISLCAECLAHVPSVVFVSGQRVMLRKRCEIHGDADAVLENDQHFYHLSNKDRWGRCFASDKVIDFPATGGACGCQSMNGSEDAPFADQMNNKTCTVLVEVTNACNLACPVCYSDARGDRRLPLKKFQEYLDKLIEAKDGLDSVQLTGGEAALHPEFWDMVAFLHARRVKKIFLPTNGILFAREEVAQRLAPFRDKVMVLLQFDGRQASTNLAMRDANPEKIREQVIANLGRLGVHMQLTMTITLGVNDDEIGWVVETGLRHPHIKVVALQPVTYSGRYTLAQDPLRRLTLSDCVKAVATQIRRTQAEDFKPIPCSHPNCGWITLFVQRFGVTANIARHINLEKAMNKVSNRTLLNSEELRSVVGGGEPSLVQRVGTWVGRKLIRSTDVFAIAIKPFMDRYNYDQDRISSCCHHLLDTHGNPVSFCEYNARLRPQDPWTSFPNLKEPVSTQP